MADIAEVWEKTLPEVKNGVTGVGIWTALNICVPVAYEQETFVLGLPANESELAGHLRLPQTRRLIEQKVGEALNQTVQLRVIEGVTHDDWETEKRRDDERRRLQSAAVERAKRERQAGSSWDGIYEQIGRLHASTPNRTMPQNRAKFFLEAVELLAEGLINSPVTDPQQERNYARCIERVAQYTELPSTLVALRVLERTFSG